MAVDFTSGTLRHRITVEMLAPMTEESYGYLEGVVLGGSYVKYGYYLDSRYCGELSVLDCNYIDNARLRIWHSIPEYDYHSPLGTFFVTEEKLGYEHGVYSGSLELHSMIQALDDDNHRDCYTIAGGTYASTVVRNITGAEGLQCNILTSCPDYRYGSAKVYDYGENVLSNIYDQTDLMGARLEVDRYGVIQVGRYFEPASQTPVFDFDFTSPESVIYGNVDISSDRFTTISGTGVHYKGKDAEGNDAEFTASADVSSASPASFGRRGRRVIKTYDVSDLNPPTRAQARNLANRYLNENDDEELEYQFEGMYIGDLTEGSVVRFSLDGKNWRKCLVKSMEVDLEYMRTKYTLKVVG